MRRVVGGTGAAAADAIAAGEALRAKVSVVEAEDFSALADAAAVDAKRRELTALKLEIDGATTSAHVKASLRDTLGACDKKLTKAAKALKASGASAGSAPASDEPRPIPQPADAARAKPDAEMELTDPAETAKKDDALAEVVDTIEDDNFTPFMPHLRTLS